MTKEEWIDNLYRIRDALDFQLRFSEMTNTHNVIIDKQDGYLFHALIEAQIKKMKEGEQK